MEGTRARYSSWFSGACLAITALVTTGSPGFAAEARPNLLLIITDQQHAGMLSCAGNPYLKTPAMDSLAAEGARFELAYSANPVCVPARMSMFTGVMPSTLGLRSNAEQANPVPKERLKHSMGWIFRQAGYRTIYGGKTHWMRGMTVESAGFELLTRDTREELAQKCAEFLATPCDQPFLLVASFINPHDICFMAIDAFAKATGRDPPYPQAITERKYLAEAMKIPGNMSEDEFFAKLCPPLPPNFEIPAEEPDAIALVYARAGTFRGWARQFWTERDWRLHRWAYCRLTEKVDAEVGLVLQALRTHGLDKKTVVIFTSDHGDLDGAHRLEHKSVLYGEAVRVPFVVCWPGVTKPGLVDRDHLISVGLDLIPTLCDFGGVEKPADLPGLSVRPLAEGRVPASWREFLVVESQAGRMLRTHRYKYTVYEVGTRREQLVDLREDPGEMINLAGKPQYNRIIQEHRRLLQEWVTSVGDKIGESFIIPPE